MNKLKVLIFPILIFSLSGCGGGANRYDNLYKAFYKSNQSVAENINSPDESYQKLKDGETPQIINSRESDVDNDLLKLKSQGYEVIGVSSFIGAKESDKNLIKHANKVGATLVLLVNTYEGRETETNTIYMPQTARTSYRDAYGSGSARTTYNAPINFTSSYKMIGQGAFYLVKNQKELKFGINVSDLTEKVKQQLERNTGALVDVVMDDSPAFYSNIIRGDVIIKIDGIDIKSAADSVKAMEEVDTKSGSSVLTVIRKERIKEVVVKFEN